MLPSTSVLALALLSFSFPFDELEFEGRWIPPQSGIMVADDLAAGADVTYHFDVEAGQTYEVETVLGSLPDTVLMLLDADNSTVLAVDDDGGDGLASKITFTAAETETLHLSVRAYQSHQTGVFAVRVEHGLLGGDCTALFPCEAQESVDAAHPERWYAFFASDNEHNEAPTDFGVFTTLGTLPDSTLAVYAADGVTQLDSNDDVVPGDPSSALSHAIPRADPQARLRFVRVAAYAPAQVGTYALTIAGTDGPPDAYDMCWFWVYAGDIFDMMDCMFFWYGA